ncbi:MAG: hypothetical protein ACI9QD_001281 [Thermoproteota archaeon]|jgi:hypothetical protein
MNKSDIIAIPRKRYINAKAYAKAKNASGIKLKPGGIAQLKKLINVYL